MIRRWLVPAISITFLSVAFWHVARTNYSLPAQTPPAQPARTPYGHSISGAGIVEARTENIAVGSPVAGVVVRVAVQPGQCVKAGEPLFALDDRSLRAELCTRQAAVDVVQAKLDRQLKAPRPEEVPVKEAHVREAQVNLEDNLDRLKRIRSMAVKGAAGEEELVRVQQAVARAQEQLAWSKADCSLLKAGVWGPDKEITRTELAEARARLEQTRTELERLTICALVDAVVLKVNVRPGEYVGTPPGQALIVLGDCQCLHIRADIDEHDIARFDASAAATATPRGQASQVVPLKFVRVEPYVVPKRALTGEGSERVDTRVLQVIYAADVAHGKLYVGQQVQVFIDAR